MSDDLIGRIAMDVSIAIDTLLENIHAFLEEKGDLLDTDELGEVMSLWHDARERNWSEPTSGALFDQVTDTTKQMTNTVDDFLKTLKEEGKSLLPPARRQFARERHRMRSHDSVTRKLVEQLQKELKPLKITFKIDPSKPPEQVVYNRLNKLLTQADLLGDYTHLWTIYEKAWMQRYEASSGEIKQAASAGDAVVHDLYREIEDQNLRLKLTGSDLVTVFFESRLSTRVSKVPAPYVVAPYWGVELVWNWLAFGHEVGHHAYANVGEAITPDQDIVGISLGDELFTHVMAYLLTLPDKTQRRIWSHWIEEIFADLFCLLRFAPISVRSMQHMFFHLPPKGLKRFLKPPPRHREWLQRADDDEHPIPYLRVYLGLDTLELLAEEFLQGKQPENVINYLRKERAKLEERWRGFFEGSDVLYHHYSEKPLSLQNMRKIGQNILQIMLNTPLYALGDKNDPDYKQPQTLVDVFFDLDAEKIKMVYKQLAPSKRGQFYDLCKEALISGEVNVRHILAALQLEFERVTAKMAPTDKQYLKELSKDTINLFIEYGDERLSREMG
jgi:hypothetical protein